VSGSGSTVRLQARIDPDMRKRKVPLVEDDPLVRLALVDADLEPVQAANASEAIAILQARPDIPAVLSDVGMPGPMNGLSLA
jgi:CheY-like chemotaxis protein